MPYPVPIGAIGQVMIDGRMYGQQILTVLHYKLGGSVDSTDGAALMDSLLQLFETGLAAPYPTYLSACSEQLVSIELRGQWILPARFAQRTRKPNIDQGSVVGEVYAVNTAVAITRRTDFAGRKERGTVHMPAVPKIFTVDDALNLAGVAAYNAVGAKLIETLVTGDEDFNFKPVLFNKQAPGQAAPLTSFTTKTFVRTMHRRTVGLGS